MAIAMLLYAVLSTVQSDAAGGLLMQSAVTNGLCSVYFIVNTILFVLALMLMILGGAIYGAATMLPGQTRGAVQAYSMGLVVGGITGAIIGMGAPWVLSVITGNTPQQITSICPSSPTS